MRSEYVAKGLARSSIRTKKVNVQSAPENNMGDVHRIGKNNPPGVDNVIAMLEEAKGEAIKIGVTKCLVIMVKEDKDLDTYQNKFLNTGFQNSEILSALTITESDVILEMRK